MKEYDPTVARVAGNILSGMICDKPFLPGGLNQLDEQRVDKAVELAKAIVERCKFPKKTLEEA